MNSLHRGEGTSFLSSERCAGASVGRRRPGRLRLGAAAALGTLALALAPVVATSTPAAADERSDAVEQQRQATQRTAELTASLEGVSAELGQAYLDLQAAQTALSSAQTELDGAEATLAQKQREQQAAADRLSVAQADLDTLTSQAEESAATASAHQDAVASLVVSTYQGDSSLTSWTYVLDSESVEDLSERASTMEIASGIQESVLAAAEQERAQDANRKARQDAVTERVSVLAQQADQAKAAAEEAATAAQAKRDEVATLTSQKQSAAASLESQKAGLQEQVRQSEADAAAAAQTIAAIDAQNRASSSYTGASSGAAAAADLGSGAIGHPITGPLTVASSYGYRVHPITGVYRLHAGVDLVASQGTPQYAAVSGSLRQFQSATCGNGIILNGGVINGQSVVIIYCHLSAYSVGSGVNVTKGQQIGLTGMTGGATGPHVHFEVHINGSTVNPMSLPGF
ncbi:MAG: peptidoglycan DD-metalloendopeptidase family protein [Actinomyces urogenitalis]|uniref:Peptidase, M23 family n=5 Tax=Actinomyces urogenitalis TaxID=103621 RepID=C0W2D7_9ACTO|nr:M23 family metallopeptidase [Actinomyces urogenitalis]EEH67131.1 peptidase, M23 family [Actinomyces urogenitalis DSM 15434]KGF03364.1 peptidase M23 [Actinomyces urogenitalis S6-C4]MBS5978083.1 peptidoglycan DD-metalloendopeptidase family protein [Actinomyces urogenitalis]MBS6072505.1 peptidoglycan DD-metalloendopeptidase family protein [Actinomyces urogenitalis]MDK8237916.1 peptidoglycan DD-metalloendopeptidase family protein [Actinomyces urogenitalis]